MRHISILFITILFECTLNASAIAWNSNYNSLVISQDISICDCIPVYRDSVIVQCIVETSYRGRACIGDTIAIRLSRYRNHPLLELGDTLLVFADSIEGRLYGPHQNGFTLLSGDIVSRNFDILSDDDLMRLINGDSLSERVLEFIIDIHFPLSDRVVSFPLIFDESRSYIEFMYRPLLGNSDLPNVWDEYPIVEIPELGSFEARVSIRKSTERGYPLPFWCEFYPVNEEGLDSSRSYFSLCGNIIEYSNGIYHINGFAKHLISYDDMVRYIYGGDVYGGLVQLEIENNTNTDSYSPLTYLALTQGRSCNWIFLAGLQAIDLLGVTSNERFRSYGEWNDVCFTNEGYIGNALEHYEDVLSVRLSDEAVCGLRDFRYSLFHLSRDSVITAELIRYNFKKGDSCYVGEIRIRSYNPQFNLKEINQAEDEVSINRISFSPGQARRYFSNHINAIDRVQTQSEILFNENNHLWDSITGGMNDFVLCYNDRGYASIETSNMVFRESILQSLYWCPGNQYLFLEAEDDLHKYYLLLVFQSTELNTQVRCRAAAHEILRNAVQNESCYGKAFIASQSYDLSSEQDSCMVDFWDFEYSLN